MGVSVLLAPGNDSCKYRSFDSLRSSSPDYGCQRAVHVLSQDDVQDHRGLADVNDLFYTSVHPPLGFWCLPALSASSVMCHTDLPGAKQGNPSGACATKVVWLRSGVL